MLHAVQCRTAVQKREEIEQREKREKGEKRKRVQYHLCEGVCGQDAAGVGAVGPGVRQLNDVPILCV